MTFFTPKVWKKRENAVSLHPRKQKNISMEQHKKSGLVLEGGGMRGMFTSGVIDVLLEHNIRLDGAVGVSAGACFGVNIKSRQPGRAIRYQLAMAGNKNYMSLGSLVFTGNLFNADYAYHVVPRDIDYFDKETFEANPMEFVVVCTDIHTGKAVYHPMDHVDYDELEWVRASASLPLVAQPVKVGGMELLDGGLGDSIPLKYFQERGYERNIVVLTRPLGYRKPKASNLWMMRWSTRNCPAVMECLRRRPDVYNEQVEYVEGEAKKGNTLLIAPPADLEIGRLEMKPTKILAVYHEGRRACLRMLDQIEEFLK